MAIYHLSMSPMSRGTGRSAIAAVAYRAAEDLLNERDGVRHDFTRRGGVEHAEIVLPSSSKAAWARSRSRLWNAAEAAERRRDARVAREIEVSLPHELGVEARLSLVREFSQHVADRFGVAVDFAVHSPHGKTDERNHHAHLMLTTRRVEEAGLGEKSMLEWENKKLVLLGLPTTHEQLRAIRVVWEEKANLYLARAGLEMRVDHRSHAERGIAIEPTQHVGVHATQMARRGLDVSRVRLESEAGLRNAQVIAEHPEQVLSLITNEKSVFDRYDIARALHRAIDDPEEFQSAFVRVMASDALVELQAEGRDADGVIEAARYSTREMVEIERNMAVATDRLLGRRGAGAGGTGRVAGVADRHVRSAIAARSYLSLEQREAVGHVTGGGGIAVVVGLAGAGKSTMLAAAREAWEAGGYRVHGATLAGKAAEGLEESSGIASRTLASWQRSWERGFDGLGAKDVLVIDEAGMVGSRQLARFVGEVDRVGAKVVLVGDPEQLQPIGAGAAFRAIAERTGFVELEKVRRQVRDWQRAASVDFGRHRTGRGLAAYEGHGAVRMEETVDLARAAIVREVLADRDARADGSRLVLAHRRVDVQALNQAIRDARQGRGELAGEVWYATSEGRRAFAAGDRILFRQNDRALGVKNGVLGTVERAQEGRLEVRLDTAKGEGTGKAVVVDLASYAAVDHGYATTIHKAQGATVDRTWVLASGSMDRHLTYVAMTRHREGVRLFAGQDEFQGVADLSLRLSRGGAKETTLDYDKARYAQRRGLELDSGIVVPKGPAKDLSTKGRFDGLRLGLQKDAATPARTMAQALAAGAGKGSMDAVPAAAAYGRGRDGDSGLAQAVERFALAWNDAHRMRAQELPVLAYQEAALKNSGQALDRVRPEATKDLLSALKHDPVVLRAMTGLKGSARSGKLIAGIEHEAMVRQDPKLALQRAIQVQKARSMEVQRNPERGRSR